MEVMRLTESLTQEITEKMQLILYSSGARLVVKGLNDWQWVKTIGGRSCLGFYAFYAKVVYF